MSDEEEEVVVVEEEKFDNKYLALGWSLLGEVSAHLDDESEDHHPVIRVSPIQTDFYLHLNKQKAIQLRDWLDEYIKGA